MPSFTGPPPQVPWRGTFAGRRGAARASGGPACAHGLQGGCARPVARGAEAPMHGRAVCHRPRRMPPSRHGPFRCSPARRRRRRSCTCRPRPCRGRPHAWRPSRRNGRNQSSRTRHAAEGGAGVGRRSAARACHPTGGRIRCAPLQPLPALPGSRRRSCRRRTWAAGSLDTCPACPPTTSWSWPCDGCAWWG